MLNFYFLGGGPIAFNGRTVLSKPDDGPVLCVFILVHSFVNLVMIHILIKNKH